MWTGASWERGKVDHTAGSGTCGACLWGGGPTISLVPHLVVVGANRTQCLILRLPADQPPISFDPRHVRSRPIAVRQLCA
jgi:hypothetical protein